MKQETLFSSEKQDWETPRDFFNTLDAEFHFEVDAAASKDNALCPLFYTEQDSGLTKDWGTHTVWVNPPYGHARSREWVKKAYEASRAGATVVMLIPARTDTAWFHDYAIHGELRFVRGRLKFTNQGNAAPFPSLVVVFRPGDNEVPGPSSIDRQANPIKSKEE